MELKSILLLLGPGATAAAFSPKITWRSCTTSFPDSFECGTLKLPMDYAKPDGAMIKLGLSRLRPNTTCDDTPGLFLEAGGPGGANSLMASEVVFQEAAGNDTGAWAPLRLKYDIIGLDMRGTGLSHPIKCDKNTFNTTMWPMIKDKKTYEKVMSANRAWAETCVNMTGPLIDHIGNDYAVQDFEMARRALGYDKFNYLGFSYGTQIGSEYADRYPDKVGRMVLDGITDRQNGYHTQQILNAAGVESAFNDFFRWAKTSKTSALHGKDPAAILDSIVEIAAKGELKSSSSNNTIFEWEILQILEERLHDGLKVKENSVSNYIEAASALNMTYIEKLGDFFDTRRPEIVDKQRYAQIAITCANRPGQPYSFEDLRNIWTVTPLVAPHYRGIGILSSGVTICNSWPVKTQSPPRGLNLENMKKLPPVMLVTALYDPATSPPDGLTHALKDAFGVQRVQERAWACELLPFRWENRLCRGCIPRKWDYP